jgi:hypothetical protein
MRLYFQPLLALIEVDDLDLPRGSGQTRVDSEFLRAVDSGQACWIGQGFEFETLLGELVICEELVHIGGILE